MTAVASLKRPMPQAHTIDPDADTRTRGGPRPGLGTPTVLIDVDRIEPHPDNPRDDFDDDDTELLALAESLKSVRLINAVHLEEIDHESERYRIIAGERRWRAAKLAGWQTIPAMVCRMDRAAAVRLMVDENLKRKDLNPIEEARAIRLLMSSGGVDGGELTREEAGPLLGKHPDVLRRKLTLLKLPKNWQNRVAKGELASWDAVHLAVYSERADVLAAVELDLAENPQDWPSGAGFLGQLRFIAERFDALPRANGAKPPPPGTPNIPKLQRDCKTNNVFVEHNGDRIVMGRYNTKQGKKNYAEFLNNLPAEAENTMPLTRRSAPVDHSLPDVGPANDREELSEEAVGKVLDSVFDVLDRLTPKQLKQVNTYLDRRARGIEGPEARLLRRVGTNK